MTKINTFLIKANNDKETIMRLPVGRYGAITPKALKMIRSRFYDGSTDTQHSMKYALNLEAFSSADTLSQALKNYQKNVL